MSDRSPAVAGRFYERDTEALREQVRSTFTHRLGPGGVPTPSDGERAITGLVSPHAGLPYSGPVAAHGVGAVAKGARPDVLVLVGPNHTGRGDPVAVSAADRWRTPLGTVPVHDGLRSELVGRSAYASVDERAHRNEHSLEVQLPFFQFLYDRPPSIVPVVMGRQSRETVDDLASAIATVVESVETSVLLVASTDLTHYEPQAVAESNDRLVIDRIEDLDAAGLLDVVERESISMCGYGPTAAILQASKSLGARSGRRLQYATSGDVTGSTGEVVGYCSATVE